MLDSQNYVLKYSNHKPVIPKYRTYNQFINQQITQRFMKTKEELRLYFENGDIPKQEDFWEWQDAYWHKDEKIDMQKVAGLENGTFNILYAEIDADKNASLAFFSKRKIVIKEGTLTIPKNFTAGLQVTDVEIPDSVTTIQESAFSNGGLTTFTIPPKVTEIPNWAFYNNRLTSLLIPDSVINIGIQAFTANQLKELRLPKGITIISQGAFSANKLTSVEIPDGVTEIHSDAFVSNQLTSVTIPASVLKIENNAFRVNQLTKVTLGPETTYLPYSFDSTVEIVGGKLIN